VCVVCVWFVCVCVCGVCVWCVCGVCVRVCVWCVFMCGVCGCVCGMWCVCKRTIFVVGMIDNKTYLHYY